MPERFESEIDFYPSKEWFEERTGDFKERWEATPWHERESRAAKNIEPSLRKYSSRINTLPNGFVPAAMDQFMAVRSEGYSYCVLNILDPIGDDRYLCEDAKGILYCVYSRSVGTIRSEGSRCFITALVDLSDLWESPVDQDLEEAIPAITYGPVLGWKALQAFDFETIAKVLARDSYHTKGVSAVILMNPAPFWALWTLSTIPPVFHGKEEVCTCWMEGRFTSDPEPSLTGAWKRRGNGKYIQYIKSGSKPFFEQQIIYDSKTMKGIILARRGSYLDKLEASLHGTFLPAMNERGYVTPLVEMAFNDILKKDIPFKTWTGPFERMDKRIREESEGRQSLSGKAALDSLNAAMQDLLPFVNAGTSPDWTALAKKHDLDAAGMENLKTMYRKFVKR